MSAPLLILASASPRRAELLRQWDFEFVVMPSNAEEIHSEDLSPVKLRKSTPIAKPGLSQKSILTPSRWESIRLCRWGRISMANRPI